MTTWKARGINGYPGMCRLYRSEIKQLRGNWLEAEAVDAKGGPAVHLVR